MFVLLQSLWSRAFDAPCTPGAPSHAIEMPDNFCQRSAMGGEPRVVARRPGYSELDVFGVRASARHCRSSLNPTAASVRYSTLDFVSPVQFEQGPMG